MAELVKNAAMIVNLVTSRSKALMVWLALALAFPALPSRCLGQVQDPAWSLPFRLSGDGEVGLESVMAVDSKNRTHVLWAETFGESPQQFSKLFYAQLDGDFWRGPIELRTLESPVTIGFLSAAIDSEQTLHLAWTEASTEFLRVGSFPCCGPILYSTASADQALEASEWTPPETVETPAFRIRLQVDSNRTVHIVYTQWFNPPRGSYHIRRLAGEDSWSDPVRLDPDIPAEHRPDVIDFKVDDSDRLHALWHYTYDPNGKGRIVQYAQSLDGGASWTLPQTLDEVGVESDELRLPYPGLAVEGDQVHAVWAGGGVIGVGRRHSFSTDGGETWSPVNQIFGSLHGQANGDALTFDSEGKLNFLGQIRWPQAVYRSFFDSGNWTTPASLYLIRRDADDPIGDRIHAHGLRAAALDHGNLVTAFTTAPAIDPHVNLYSMHSRRPFSYFSHYGVGEGLSMAFVVVNPTALSAQAVLRTFDRQGQPQGVPFEERNTDELVLELPPHSTKVLKTTDSATELLSGFAALESSSGEVGALAIFRFDSGLEASALPTPPGRRFAFFAERSPVLNTGIALLRHSSRPVYLKLYDLNGVLVAERQFDFSGAQVACFLDEIFQIGESFQGVLVMESEGDFAPLGLRLGGNAFSTIPVSRLDFPRSPQAFYFPHYGDGSGLSMVFSNSNLAEATATGSMSVFDPAGLPQELPFAVGAESVVDLSLEPNATAVLRTDGNSAPPKSGYVRVDLDQGDVTGTAIFQFSDGREASVLPASTGRNFSIFVERSPTLDTGIAIFRTSVDPVQLTLYDLDGEQVASREYAFEGLQQAVFLSQLFAVPENFQGLLVLQSESEFAPFGLRFGQGVLSTLPSFAASPAPEDASR